jgi:L-alanine-DL-glutamate epimerase-like enolase superfamily enzyme
MSSDVGSATVNRLRASAYSIPTDLPESDGTLKWNKTTLVLVEIEGGGRQGLGFTYADRATAVMVNDLLADIVNGRNLMDLSECWLAMVRAIRNLGRPGVSSMAIAAVDVALWDLKAKLLDLSLSALLGSVREGVPVYGSGGFTSYSVEKLCDQLAGWVAQGIRAVKMKIGTQPDQDLYRVSAARAAIGPNAELFVDANGAYSTKQALHFSRLFAEQDVRWFEEPVSSDDLAGLHLLRERVPASMEIAAGEYGYDLHYFRRMLEAEAVDVLQADVTRCAGITGMMQIGALCWARSMPLSAHCAPSIHAHAGCALLPLRNLEYFHDHARIEHMLFDGALSPSDGELIPDRKRPGLGLEFKHKDAAPYAL